MSNTPVRREELAQVFRDQEREPQKFLIGAESEKFAVNARTGAPLWYGGDFSVCRILSYLGEHHGWQKSQEVPNGPVLGLKKGRASITLEPAAQLELSGEALPDLHAVNAEARDHLKELKPISEEMGLVWLTTGFHPLAKLEDLPWVPKQRYPIMREYLPKMGSGGLDMMQRTATVQGNFDWSSEQDALRKMAVALRLSPLMHAWFANAPFKEGEASGTLSHRGDVWCHMDPSRSGLLPLFWDPELWDSREPSYDDYVEWTLDAGMFLIRRDGEFLRNTGQTFRDFLQNGFEGHVATRQDYELHLTTLFPEVRLKNTLEVRAVDSLPPELAMASLAVWTGILYDETALARALSLLSRFTLKDMELARPGLISRGLHASLAGRDGFEWAEELLDIARAGLARRGLNEGEFLIPAEEIVTSRMMPAERALARYRDSGSLIEATRLLAYP